MRAIAANSCASSSRSAGRDALDAGGVAPGLEPAEIEVASIISRARARARMRSSVQWRSAGRGVVSACRVARITLSGCAARAHRRDELDLSWLAWRSLHEPGVLGAIEASCAEADRQALLPGR